MGLSSSQDTASCAASQELTSIFWNLRVHSCVYKRATLLYFKKFCLLHLCHNFSLHSGDGTALYTLFFTLLLIKLLETKPLPNFCHHQIVVSIKICCPEGFDIM
jgi:hypothetical protein